MIVAQIVIIIFLTAILGLVLQEERRRRIQSRKSARLNGFWDKSAERRKSVRINTRLAVNYEVIPDGASRKRSSISRNISLGGINLSLNEKLLPGTRMNLQLELPDTPKAIFAQGQVVWVNEIPPEDCSVREERFFAAGIKFTQLGPGDEIKLKNFIDHHLTNADK